MTLVAVLSDTHLPRGARRLPDECVDRLRGADVVLHAGDFLRLSVLEHLRAFDAPVYGVHGNMDDAELQAALPKRRVVEVDGCRIGLVHDAGPRLGRHERLERDFTGCAAVVYGHSHLPEVSRSARRRLLVVNPGSPTERRRAPSHTMAMLHVADGDAVAELIHLPT